MRRKIYNPHRNDDPAMYQCIGCSPFNPIGLHLEFWEEGDGLYAEWEPRSEFVGWVNILHGGIQATLLDEMAAWVVYTQCQTAGVTAEMQVKYRDTVYTNQGKIILRGKLLEQNRRIATIQAQLFNAEQKLCTEATLKYFIFPDKIAREKFHYPGPDAFYEP